MAVNDNSQNQVLDITPDILVKQLTYGSKVYSTNKLKNILSSVVNEDAAVVYDVDVTVTNLFPLKINKNIVTNEYIIIWDVPIDSPSGKYNYTIYSDETGSAINGFALLDEILNFITVGDDLYLNVNLNLDGYNLPWINVAIFDSTTGNIKSDSSDLYEIITKYQTADQAPISRISTAAAKNNIITKAFTVVNNVENAYVEHGHYKPLSVAIADVDTYTALCDSDNIKNDILYAVKMDHIDGLNNTIINVADPIESTDAVNKRYLATSIGNILKNVPDPVTLADAANKHYVDASLSNTLKNIADPVDQTDVVNKRYVDNKTFELDEAEPIEYKLQSIKTVSNSAQYILWSLIKLSDMFEIPESAIKNNTVDVKSISFKLKDHFDNSSDLFMLKLEIYENSSVVEDYKNIPTFSNLIPIATSLNSALHKENTTLTFTFSNCTLNPNSMYICRWVADLKVNSSNIKYSWLYGHFKLVSATGYKYAHGTWNGDPVNMVTISTTDYLVNNLAPFASEICLSNTDTTELDDIKSYALVLKSIIMKDNNNNYYSISVVNGNLVANKL